MLNNKIYTIDTLRVVSEYYITSVFPMVVNVNANASVPKVQISGNWDAGAQYVAFVDPSLGGCTSASIFKQTVNYADQSVQIPKVSLVAGNTYNLCYSPQRSVAAGYTDKDFVLQFNVGGIYVVDIPPLPQPLNQLLSKNFTVTLPGIEGWVALIPSATSCIGAANSRFEITAGVAEVTANDYEGDYYICYSPTDYADRDAYFVNLGKNFQVRLQEPVTGC
eukprot:TRINITY_DN1725_c0_g1_i1.p1 TRINITY_DN1725_c0_g1~~TRINITY_DN1725_c0_g1_i1.p1  ORF type:complete len:221 (-),score=31.29 TRINITY_DN1725_c0_g1_i1:37-699(-)